MTDLTFQIEWEGADGVSHPALSRTWARLEVTIAGECVTTVFDKRTRSTRSGVYGPAFLLAEWIVRNFWFALFESQPADAASHAWMRRHSLASSREGTALPDVRWFRDEDTCIAEWHPVIGDASPVNFVTSGRRALPLNVVRTALCRTVDDVLEQLRGCDHPDVTALRSDWEAVVSASGDDAKLCQLAARMGLDAFEAAQVTDEVARIITGAAVRLPAPTRDDFFDSGVSVSVLAPTLGAVAEAVAPTEGAQPRVAGGTPRLRHPLPIAQGTAYVRGYALARDLRTQLNQSVNGRVDLVPLLGALGWSGLDAEDQAWQVADRHVKAVVGLSAKGTPLLVAGPKRSPHKRFLIARGVFALLSGATSAGPRLLTSSGASMQAASRAFAAELLAPADTIKKRLRSSIDEETIEDVASELDVSTEVIRHQIENHALVG